MIFCSISGNLLYANNQTDSLMNFINKAKYDTAKVVAYEQLALVYRKTNKDSAYYFNQKAIDQAKK